MFLLARDIRKLAQMSATFRYWSDAALGYCCQVDAVGLKLCGGKAHRQTDSPPVGSTCLCRLIYLD